MYEDSDSPTKANFAGLIGVGGRKPGIDHEPAGNTLCQSRRCNAYQVSESGPFDLIFVPGFVSNPDVQWETPGYSDLFARPGRFSRLIRFDAVQLEMRRVIGISEGVLP